MFFSIIFLRKSQNSFPRLFELNFKTFYLCGASLKKPMDGSFPQSTPPQRWNCEGEILHWFSFVRIYRGVISISRCYLVKRTVEHLVTACVPGDKHPWMRTKDKSDVSDSTLFLFRLFLCTLSLRTHLFSTLFLSTFCLFGFEGASGGLADLSRPEITK